MRMLSKEERLQAIKRWNNQQRKNPEMDRPYRLLPEQGAEMEADSFVWMQHCIAYTIMNQPKRKDRDRLYSKLALKPGNEMVKEIIEWTDKNISNI